MALMPSLASVRERVGRGEIRFENASRPGRDSISVETLAVTGIWSLNFVSTRFMDRISSTRASRLDAGERLAPVESRSAFLDFPIPSQYRCSIQHHYVND